MAKGKKYDPEIKERALALLAVYDSVSKVAKELNLPWSTVDTWKKEKSDDGSGFEKLREQKKEEFIGNMRSRSYAITADAPSYSDFIDELNKIFAEHAVNGIVTEPIETQIYLGKF